MVTSTEFFKSQFSIQSVPQELEKDLKLLNTALDKLKVRARQPLDESFAQVGEDFRPEANIESGVKALWKLPDFHKNKDQFYALRCLSSIVLAKVHQHLLREKRRTKCQPGRRGQSRKAEVTNQLTAYISGNSLNLKLRDRVRREVECGELRFQLALLFGPGIFVLLGKDATSRLWTNDLKYPEIFQQYIIKHMPITHRAIQNRNSVAQSIISVGLNSCGLDSLEVRPNTKDPDLPGTQLIAFAQPHPQTASSPQLGSATKADEVHSNAFSESMYAGLAMTENMVIDGRQSTLHQSSFQFNLSRDNLTRSSFGVDYALLEGQTFLPWDDWI
ncbi:MAG: hypothetical protein M4579_006741 [Chaenotheca gracillima]|nr:MAG: hypothetical protein M4579_006741 [Chaenotheca gracillima]